MATPPLDDETYGQMKAEYLDKIKVLSEYAWDHGCGEPVVMRWLDGFSGASGHDLRVEQINALHLLSNFLYFGVDEVRELLRALYRDIFQYGVMRQVRIQLGGRPDEAAMDARYTRELRATRFLPLGNPSESSSHILYYFRQENDLAADLFANVHQIVDDGYRTHKGVTRCVFLDDFAGTGHQAIEYGVEAQRLRDKGVRTISYYAMLATPEALDIIGRLSAFDDVRSVVEVGSDLRAFTAESLFYSDSTWPISRSTMCQIAKFYGRKLWVDFPLGYGSDQLLLGFAHNVPDNTLPIFWADRPPSWYAPFPRYRKWSDR